MGCGGSTGKRVLSEDVKAKLEEMFSKMDGDQSNTITKEEAQKFFTSFSKVNTKAFFDEVDEDKSGTISKAEFMGFWDQVRVAGYTNEQILEELEELTNGSDWVNWKDTKDVGMESKTGPQAEYRAVKPKVDATEAKDEPEPAAKAEPAAEAQPAAEAEPAAKAEPAEEQPVEQVSEEVSAKLEEMFARIDVDKSNTITKEEALKFFTSFSKVNTKAFFDEVDDDRNGLIAKEEFMGFWQQVRNSGYKNEEILEELEDLVKGGAWVNWEDGKEVSG
eukprot:Skav208281  [mRNA]  locus=scaffold1802:216845:236400:- [translate_table: standard]